MEIIISLLLGTAGGNIGGALIEKLNLGLICNSFAGIIGGGMGNQILQSAFASTAQSSMMSSVLGGTLGGILVMSLVGIIKRSWTQESS